MTYNPDKHHRSVWPPERQSIRLMGYDYSRSGAYFVTICIQDRDCFLGEIVNGEMQLNAAGQMIFDWWNRLPHKYSHIELEWTQWFATKSIYQHIVRDENELNHIRKSIIAGQAVAFGKNSSKWDLDNENPDNPGII